LFLFEVYRGSIHDITCKFLQRGILTVDCSFIYLCIFCAYIASGNRKKLTEHDNSLAVVIILQYKERLSLQLSTHTRRRSKLCLSMSYLRYDLFHESLWFDFEVNNVGR
jgi:hypothetical protein